MNIPRTRVDSQIKTDSTGDIAFLLVVFFVLTAAFAATKGMPFDLPTHERPGKEGKPSVLITVAADGALEVDCRPMAADGILEYLAPRLTANPDKPVIVCPDEAAPYRELVAVLDTLSLAPRHGFSVQNIQVCTPRIIREYVEIFSIDPFASHCSG